MRQIKAVRDPSTESYGAEPACGVQTAVKWMKPEKQQSEAEGGQTLLFISRVEFTKLVRMRARPHDSENQNKPQYDRLTIRRIIDNVIDRDSGGEQQPTSIEEKAPEGLHVKCEAQHQNCAP